MSKANIREIILAVLALVIIIPGSWLMGGYYSLAPHWMGIGGWLALVFALYELFTDKGLRNQNPALKRIWVLWIGLLVYLGISLCNPAYVPIEVARGMTYRSGDPVEWLPSVVALGVSAPMVLQLTGSLVLAWSLLAVIRTRRSIRFILLGLVVNAMVLGIVGAYFKVTGADNILNYFASVNDKFYASFTYHNHWVAFASFHLFIASGLLAHFREHIRDRGGSVNLVVFLWVACFFLFLSLLLVESRTGVLAALIYLSYVVMHNLRNRLKSVFQFHWPSLLGVVGLIILGVISYVIVLPQLTSTSDRISKSWYSFWAEEESVDNFRFNTGPKITADLINEKPVLGWGWGSYPLAMSIFAPQYLDNQMAQFAHNDWLQFIAELGALGVFLFAFPLVHMSTHLRARDLLTRFTRWGIVVLLFFAFFEGPMTNPVILASVLVVFCCDLSSRHEVSVRRIY